MKAQDCYDLRNDVEFCSGSDLSEFFLEQTGDASINGDADIDLQKFSIFVGRCMRAIDHNNPGSNLPAELWVKLKSLNRDVFDIAVHIL